MRARLALLTSALLCAALGIACGDSGSFELSTGEDGGAGPLPLSIRPMAEGGDGAAALSETPPTAATVEPLAEPSVAAAAAAPARNPALPSTDGLPDMSFYPVPAPTGAAPVFRGGAAAPAVAAVAAVVVDEASGAVLYSKDAYAALAPASLTKIATAVLVLEKGDLDREVTVDVDSRQMPGSSLMGLLPGDRFTIRDLLYGLMLPSGNDAALALARATSGSDAAFVVEMNALMERLGLYTTHYANPHGLGAPNHMTSAYDLAMLSRYAMMIPGFKEIVTAPWWVAKGSREIPMLLNDANRDADAAALLDWAFAAYEWPKQ
jgi:serine-type D-Ala-D-Ala carboxypeptidase (penicillin-binding protein 5/6)